MAGCCGAIGCIAMLAEQLLSAIASHASERPAVYSAGRTLSYSELARLVNEEADWIRAASSRCALLAQNGWRWLIADLALLASRSVNVPLPDSFTAPQIRHVLADAGIDGVLTDRPADFLRAHGDFSIVGASPVTGLTLLRRRATDQCAIGRDVVKITYTSGSTGTPKGVCLAGRAIAAVANSLAAATADLGVTRHLCVLPLATLLENIAGLYVPALIGAQMVVESGPDIGVGYARLDAPRFLSTLTRHQPQSLVLVPELLRLLVHAAGNGWIAPGSLRFIAVGGASVAPTLVERAAALGLPVFEGYGLSECASVVCLNTPGASRPGSVGRPLPHAQVRIDASGEICVRGAVMSGYLGDDAATCDEIRTGDLGEFDAEGFLHVRGRAKNLLITSMGRNITPEWVERELLAEPVIAQAMAVGEGRPFVGALIVPTSHADDAAVDAALGCANARLPDYARVRRWARFPQQPSLGNGLLTANGRLRRAEIQARFAAAIATIYESEESFFHEVLPSAVSA